jgi:hypothetical protein
VNLIVDHIGTWLALTFVGLLTVFSDKILGRIRFALNRADLRSAYYEELAANLSAFVFYADLFHVRMIRGESGFDDLPDIAGDVNEAYVTLKTKEYVYRSWVRRYWNKDGIAKFELVMQAAKNVYEAIIEFNEKGKEKQKTAALGKHLAELRLSVDKWLSELDA